MDYGTPTKLRYAKQVAAALGFVGLITPRPVSVETVAASGAGGVPAFRGRPSLPRLMKVIDRIPAVVAAN